MNIEFSPVIYEHAAKLINKSPWEVSRSSEFFFKAHLEAYRRYGHSPVVIGIDIYNLEAEAYGATLNEPGKNEIPSISMPLFSSAQDILNFRIFDPKHDGRLPLVIAAGKKLKQKLPEIDIRIPVSGPFSVASNLISVENLVIESVMSPDLVKQAMEYLTIGQLRFCEEICKNNLQISFFESAAAPPLISPQTFKDILQPALKKLFHSISQQTNQKPAFIIGGDTTPILESILEIGTNYIICPTETDQLSFIEKMKSFPDIMVRINMNANVMISTNWNEVKHEVDRVLAIAKKRDNVCIGTGVLPYETDPNLVFRIRDYISSK